MPKLSALILFVIKTGIALVAIVFLTFAQHILESESWLPERDNATGQILSITDVCMISRVRPELPGRSFGSFEPIACDELNRLTEEQQASGGLPPFSADRQRLVTVSFATLDGRKIEAQTPEHWLHLKPTARAGDRLEIAYARANPQRGLKNAQSKSGVWVISLMVLAAIGYLAYYVWPFFRLLRSMTRWARKSVSAGHP